MSRLNPRQEQPRGVYTPSVTRGHVYGGYGAQFGYNHDASLIWFSDRWLCLWNAAPEGESQPPQRILQATSQNFADWSAPVSCFSDSNYSTNPVDIGDTSLSWQPGTIVINGILHALWIHCGDAQAGTYVSRLSSPSGKWTNERLSVAPVVIGGITYEQCFVTGDPVAINGGRILCPVVFQSTSTEIDVPAGVTSSTFLRRAKLAAVLVSDDHGVSWNRGGTVTVPTQPGCVWEPFISVLLDGAVKLFVRNLFKEQAQSDMLLAAISTDGGTTWGALASTGMEVQSSRGTVVNRDLVAYSSLMLINDNVGLRNPFDRRSLALAISEDGDEYILGPGLTDDGLDFGACYPSAKIKNGKLFVVYSVFNGTQSGSATEIRRLTVENPPGRYNAMGRSNATYTISPAFISSPIRHFRYSTRSMAMRTIQTIDQKWSSAVTVVAALKLEPVADRSGALFDCRTVGSTAGFVVNVVAGEIYVQAAVGGSLSSTQTGLVIPGAEWVTVIVTLDSSTGEGAAYLIRANGSTQSCVVNWGTPLDALNPPVVASLASARAGSTIGSIYGDVRRIAVWPSVLSDEQIRSVQHDLASALSTTPCIGAASPAGKPAIDLDAATPDAGSNDAAWLAAFTATGELKGSVSIDESSNIVVAGAASAAVLATTSDPGNYFIRYKVSNVSGDTVIISVGNGSHFSEVVRESSGKVKYRVFSNGYYRDYVYIGFGANDTATAVKVVVGGAALIITHAGCSAVSIPGVFTDAVYIGKAFRVGDATQSATITMV